MANDLEESMGPGRLSKGGFLGKDEKLGEVLNADDETVKRLGLTHGKIADRLEYFIKAVNCYPERDGKIVDGRFHVSGIVWRGVQPCPWDGTSKYGSIDMTVKNLATEESISFPGLIVHLIREHKFYEGPKSHYRVDPEKAARVLEIK